MSYDVVVVGGGVGGLTVAALLTARGVNVCLLERQSQVGGCIGRVQFSGIDFEPGMGLHSSWGNNEIFAKVFSELAVDPPRASRIESDFVVRLARDQDIRLKKDEAEFFDELRNAFPECPQAAIEFYKQVDRVWQFRYQQAQTKFDTGFLAQAWRRIWPSKPGSNLADFTTRTALSFAGSASSRFQRFIDAQLRAFLHTSIDRCAFLAACDALSLARRDLYAIESGVATLAERLAESIKVAGGSVRLDSPVLRLAYDKGGHAIGVDLLSGETVLAKRAIISNLTIWDTYGKLVGLNNTPSAVKSELRKLQSSGAYLIYANVDNAAVARLPARNFLVATDEATEGMELSGEFTVTIGPKNSNGSHPGTIKTACEVAPWFSFQSSEEDYEEWDQSALESLWDRLHHALPELGSGIEVIETANPRTCYDLTRRKLGMVMGVESALESLCRADQHVTTIPNVYIVGDTVAGAPTIAGVVESSLLLANRLTK
jgi:phytoene dehydrogenase-like protein